jgi:hypothetical protein
MWRTIQIANPGGRLGSFLGSGTSRVATLQGVGALGIAGVCIAVAAGVYLALGAPYYEARKRAQERGFIRGFSRGFVTGILNWKWPIAWDRMRLRVAYMNAADPVAGRIEADANNEGLFIGFCLGTSAPEGAK